MSNDKANSSSDIAFTSSNLKIILNKNKIKNKSLLVNVLVFVLFLFYYLEFWSL